MSFLFGSVKRFLKKNLSNQSKMDLFFEIEPQEVFELASAEILNLFETNIKTPNADPNTIQAAKDDLKKLIFSSDYDLNTVIEILKGKGWREDKVNYFISEIQNKKTELLYSVLLDHQTSFGETVVDFNWWLKLVAGTNELKTMKYPLVQLILATICSTGEKKQRLYELSKDMLVKLITVLENID